MLLECARIGNVVAPPIGPAGRALNRIFRGSGFSREPVMQRKIVRA